MAPMHPRSGGRGSPLPGDDRNCLANDAAALLSTAVREAGALALESFGNSPRQWPKGKSSIVCEADILVDRFLHERLAAAAPDFGWLSEETEDNPARRGADYVWIVDPIDGTRSYLAGKADWAVCAALARRGRPVAAGIFAPVTAELFLATGRGGGSREDVPLAVNPGGDLEGATVAGPRRFTDWLARIHSNIVVTPRIGSL